MAEAELTPTEVASAAVDFAAERLGPCSSKLLHDPAPQALVVARMRAGATLGNAVLAIIHSRLDNPSSPPATAAQSHSNELADEFLSFFLADLARLGHSALGPGLRRFLDSGDLVQSVLGDLWPDMAQLKFESRDAFLALLAARLRWKASDRSRRLQAGKRREDLRKNADADLLATNQPGPVTELVSAEEWQQTALALARLNKRDRELVRGHLNGLSWAELAAENGLQPESARKAVQRALARARQGGVGA
jgi:RNA polymerase sigma factor (sigma-70 family)